MNGLTRALDDLVTFFRGVPGDSGAAWAGRLYGIRQRLAAPDSRQSALEDLGRCFGGMGTLNDYAFHPANGNIPAGQDPDSLNRRVDRLLDRAFREYRLLGVPRWARWYWRWLAWTRRGPPRIRNAFARPDG